MPFLIFQLNKGTYHLSLLLSQVKFFLSLSFYRLSLNAGWALKFFIVYRLSQVGEKIIVLSLSQVEKKVIAATTDYHLF